MTPITSAADAPPEANLHALATEPLGSTEQKWNHDAILKMTAELFPKARIVVSEESDPEVDDDEYFAVLVETPGSVDDVVALHREWHDRIGSIAPETANFYRLLLDIND